MDFTVLYWLLLNFTGLVANQFFNKKSAFLHKKALLWFKKLVLCRKVKLIKKCFLHRKSAFSV